MKSTDNAIASVTLDGFKGFDRVFKLARQTLLAGENGLGKSAVMEAVKWCLTGRVPAGKTNDAQAKYFGPRGGSVTLTTTSGAWLRRTLNIDQERSHVSIDRESQDGRFNKDPVPGWESNDMTLEIDNFLKLSAAKRRDFVLELVGGGERLPDMEVEKLVATHFLKLVAGEAATLETLEQLEELDESTAAICGAWVGVWSVLRTYLTSEQSASDLWLKLGEAANERKLSARQAAVEASAARRDLEASAKESRPLAAQIDMLKTAAEAANDAMRDLSSRSALRSEKQRALDSAVAEREQREAEQKSAEESLKELGELGDDPGEKIAPADAELEQLIDSQSVTEKELMTERLLNRKREELKQLLEEKTRLAQRIEAHEKEPVGQLEAAVTELEDYELGDDPDFVSAVEDVRAATDLVSLSWRDRKQTIEQQSERLGKKLKELRKLLRGKEEPGNVELRLEEELHDLRERERERRAAHAQLIRESAAARERWESKKNRIDIYTNQKKSAKNALGGMRKRIAQLEKELKGFKPVDMATVTEDARRAEFAYREAERAAGAVLAFERAGERAARDQLKERVWAAVESAVKRSREVYVAEIVAPIVGDIETLLRRAGCDHKVFVTLMNDRGAPIFDLGWYAGDSKRSLDALSHGESVLYVSALALAIAKRTDERRLLLVEAEPVSLSNLPKFIVGLAAMESELDACVVATPISIARSPGWLTYYFALDGQVKTIDETEEPGATIVRPKPAAKKTRRKKA